MKLPRVAPHRSGSMDITPRPLDIIATKLTQNSLSEFKIGFEDGEFHSTSDVQRLIHIIQDKYFRRLAADKASCLRSIRIGWKLPKFAIGPVLEQIIPMLLQYPANVELLQLNLNSWVQPPVVERLISWYTLKTVELGSLRIQTCGVSLKEDGSRRRRKTDRVFSGLPRKRSVSPDAVMEIEFSSDDGETIKGDETILRVIPFLPSSLETLHLVDCNLSVDNIAPVIRILRKRRNLRCLSLRLNRRLCVDGWMDDLLEKLPLLKELDLSICDLGVVDGMNLANSLIAHPNTRLTRLSVAGNCRLDESMETIFHACVKSGTTELECSHCEVTAKLQGILFDLMATHKPCLMRSVKLQGARIINIPALVRCIEQNESLECLLFNNPRDPNRISPQSLALLLTAIRKNFYLSEFEVDLPYRVDEDVMKELKYWLTFNGCGRSILMNDPRRNWPDVIAAVDGMGDIDTLHSFIRMGIEQSRIYEVA